MYTCTSSYPLLFPSDKEVKIKLEESIYCYKVLCMAKIQLSICWNSFGSSVCCESFTSSRATSKSCTSCFDFLRMPQISFSSLWYFPWCNPSFSWKAHKHTYLNTLWSSIWTAESLCLLSSSILTSAGFSLFWIWKSRYLGRSNIMSRKNPGFSEVFLLPGRPLAL